MVNYLQKTGFTMEMIFALSYANSLCTILERKYINSKRSNLITNFSEIYQ